MNSLRAQLLLSYIVIIVVCLAVVALALLLLLRASPLLDQVTYRNLNTDVGAILATLEAEPLQNMSLSRLERALGQVAGRLGPGRRILLLDQRGMVILDTEQRLAVNTQPLQGAQVQRLPDGRRRGVISLPGGPSAGDRWLFVADELPIAVAEGQAKTLIVAAPRSNVPLVGLLAELVIVPQLFIAGIVGLVLSILLAVYISRSVAQPLQRTAQAAQAIAHGDFSQTLPVSGPDEVKGLATSFNYMVQQVKASQQAQRDFVANVSHELKTPLTSIQGFAQAILDGTAMDGQAVHHAASVIHAEAERMRRLVEDLLDLARLDSGQMVMRREPVDLKAVLGACAERFALRAQQAGVQLEVQTPDLPRLIGDGDRLAQVFSNLIDNALQHTPAGGRVTVRAFSASVAGGTSARPAARSPHLLTVEVADTGTGIPAEDLPRIFERFYQVDKSRARSGAGAGLGLAISREIVQAHGGTISVESAPGLGTRFIVRLPLDGMGR